MNKKGAFSITGLIMGAVTVIVYVSLLPVLQEIINQALPYLNTMETFVITLIPLIMLLMIIVGVINSGKPDYQYVG